MDKHTPGPWLFGELSGQITNTKGTLIADLSERVDDKGRYTSKALADARLIVAAPEMVALLRVFAMDYPELSDIQMTTIDKARALLARVGG